MIEAKKRRDSMPVGYISMTDPFSSLGDDVRRICSRNAVDPDAFGWLDPVRAEWPAHVAKRIANSRLFIGIYQNDVRNTRVPDPGGTSPHASSTELDLATACRQFKKADVLCFVQRDVDRSRELETLLERYRKSYEKHEFEAHQDLLPALDKAVKQWVEINVRAPERGSVLSVQVECRDRFGVLACLTDRLYQKGGNILRAEHRNHLQRSFIRVIVNWPVREKPDPTALKGELEQALGELLGAGGENPRIAVEPIVGGDGTVLTRGVFRVMFWDGRGVAERIFGVLADDKLSIIESHLETIPTSPALGRLELMVNAGGSRDERLSLIQNRLQGEPDVLLVERSTERGTWWY